ncbi:hypothetical protein Tco_1103251 [Tanacetum coccineum]
MAKLSEDIQCAGSDTRLPMLDRTDFASWQQRIRLYCQGKENGVNILKSINEGPFQMGTFWETLAEGNQGALQLGLPKDIYSLINHYINAKDIWDNVKMLWEGSELTKEDRESQLYDDFEHFRQNKGETIHDYYVRFVIAVKLNIGIAGYGGAQNRVGNANPGQARQIKCYNCNDFVFDEASPSYDSDILFEVPDHDNYQDVVCEHHEVHEMHDDYVKDNAVPVVHSNESFVPNDVYMMILNDIYEPSAQCVSVTTQNNVVDNLLIAELATYKEQVELYERRAKFELTKREQKINEQLRIVIADRNLKEENLKRELHSIKLQLTSTINHNKSMVEEVTSLKKDFKQKENKYLEEFLDMKALKEKVKDKLYKQDQSLQTVHMLCKPKPYYDKQKKVAIGYKNPLCLTRSKQVQLALYNVHEIIKTNHVLAIVQNSEDTLEIAEITRKKMNNKMKDPECVKKKVKIAPHDYS